MDADLSLEGSIRFDRSDPWSYCFVLSVGSAQICVGQLETV